MRRRWRNSSWVSSTAAPSDDRDLFHSLGHADDAEGPLQLIHRSDREPWCARCSRERTSSSSAADPLKTAEQTACLNRPASASWRVVLRAVPPQHPAVDDRGASLEADAEDEILPAHAPILTEARCVVQEEAATSALSAAANVKRRVGEREHLPRARRWRTDRRSVARP